MEGLRPNEREALSSRRSWLWRWKLPALPPLSGRMPWYARKFLRFPRTF